MLTRFNHTFSFLVVLALFNLAANSGVGQSLDATTRAPSSSPIVTAASAGDSVRFTAPSNIIAMRVEVYAGGGDRVFDSGRHNGNVFDWRWQDEKDLPLSPDSYLCVVTVQSLSGRTSRKLANVFFANKQATLEPIDVSQLNPTQTAALKLAPIDAAQSDAAESVTPLTIIPAEQQDSATVIAHDGTDGQIARTRGALFFRIGDFFTGNDQEQMRLTEAGDLGIGTAKPKFKLDVAGAVRARQGFVFNDGSLLDVNDKGALTLTNSEGNIVPNATGSGTKDQLAKWTDNSGTLGDSVLTESGGRIGVGTTTPAFKLDLVDNTSGAGGFQLANGTNGAFAQLQNRLVNNNGALGYYGITSSSYTQAPILSNRAFFGSYQVDTVIWTQTANDILFATNGLSANTERMRITSGGTVGIGTNMPGFQLDVAGTINTTTQFNIGGNRILTVTGAVNFPNSNTFAGVGTGTLTTPSANNGSGHFNSFFGKSAGASNTTGGSNAFFGNGAGENNMTGDANTFLGTIAGHSNTTGNSNSFIGINAGPSNTAECCNTFLGAVANGAPGITNATAIGFRAQVTQSNSLVLGSIKGVNVADADTNVGIGTTEPQQRLHVDGNEILSTGSSAGFKFRNRGSSSSADDWVWYSDSNIARFWRSGVGDLIRITTSGNVGIGPAAPDQTLSVTVGTASKPGGGSWAIYSDERLKTIKGNFTSGLNAVMQLHPLRYEYKPDNALGIKSEGEHIGFSAQAVQKVIPEAVIMNDKGYLLVNNDPIMWTMLNAIKEQQKQIETLRAQNMAMSTHLQALEKNLKKRVARRR